MLGSLLQLWDLLVAPAGSHHCSLPLFSAAEHSKALTHRFQIIRFLEWILTGLEHLVVISVSPARWGLTWPLSRVSPGGPTKWLIVCLQPGRTDGLGETSLALELQRHWVSFWWLRFPRMMSLKYLFYVSSCPYLFHLGFLNWPQDTAPRWHTVLSQAGSGPLTASHWVLFVLSYKCPHAGKPHGWASQR